jgi:hypothetical protein
MPYAPIMPASEAPFPSPIERTCFFGAAAAALLLLLLQVTSSSSQSGSARIGAMVGIAGRLPDRKSSCTAWALNFEYLWPDITLSCSL